MRVSNLDVMPYRISLALVVIAWLTGPASAAPKGGQVVAGDARIVQSRPHHLDVVQRTGRAAINWRSFSIGARERVNFRQPSKQSATLNRVTGQDISSIQGRLTANGRVFLVNPNGILFGKGAQVDVGGLVASTANIGDEDFMAGRYAFKEPGRPGSRVVNEGQINAAEGGLVAFVAAGVENSGAITARLGRVALASGDAFTLDLYGDELVDVQVDDSTLEGLTDSEGRPIDTLVKQSGTIRADGGEVLLTAARAQAAIDNVINMSGIIRTRSIGKENGEIVLYGGGEGKVQVSGVLDASGRNAMESGGTVKVLGDQVTLRDGARVDVSGDRGGGQVLLGGDYQGKGPVPRSRRTVVERRARVKADALRRGDGGKVIVWSDGATNYHGHISAKGGTEAGDGGLIEVSGKKHLKFRGDVNLRAAQGAGGTLLLDPENIVVGKTVRASSIERILLTGATASLQADNDITVEERIDGTRISFRPGGGLNLRAGNDIAINNDILINNGAVMLRARNGDITMGSGPSNSITRGKGVVIGTGTGDISMTARRDIGVQDLATSGDINLTSTAGSVTLNQDLGGVFGVNPQIGGLSIGAAKEALIDGRIIAGGPVTLSAPLVTLKHSIFTSNQDIVLGRSGGEVILDPAGDEVLPADADRIASDAQGGRLEVGRPISGGADSVVDVELISKQITLDTGTTGAGDIKFLGELDIEDTLRNAFVQFTDGVDDPPIDYVALRLSAGTGNISFAEGIATRASTGGVRVDDPNADPNSGSTNSIDLTVETGAGISFGLNAFVNSFNANGIQITDGQPVEIFHANINIEDTDGNLPPIFPEPQLPGRFGQTLGGGALGLAQVLGVASAVEDTQREDSAACEEGTGADGEEGGAGGDCASPAGGDVADLYVEGTASPEGELPEVD
ncbi:MAG: filamentous hemagglutinin N-terminal domain-containing protein [Gammaproteobacteria bacterium]